MIHRFPIELNLFSLRSLAFRINFPTSIIDKIIDEKSTSVKIFTLKMKRSDGSIKERILHNPNSLYKSVLRRINSKILSKAILPNGVCGAIIGKSLLDMVKVHCGREAVYKIDLMDFYPNIKIGRIIIFLLKLGCSCKVALLIANFITYDNTLPQGFPTSPMMANLIANKLDEDHLIIAKKYNLERTRWVDDIVFSGRIKDLEKAIPLINSAIKYNKFDLNVQKQEFMRRANEPMVTGLIINKHKPYIPFQIISKIDNFL